ncbi:hypothetical protein CNR22_04685 [Sphingobacteriaceae bacterium]|nr:hypothetical protein CNR22_04685 [Sphingobacteriaceae bacterium]
MNQKTRVFYIEDYKVVKEGVNYLLSQYEDIEMIEKDFELTELDTFIAENKIDVFILDLQLYTKDKKGINGFDVCEMIISKYPSIKIVAHSMYDNVENVNKIFGKGATGFVSKLSGHVELLNAIRRVNEGKWFLCKEIVAKTKNSAKFIKQDEPLLKAISEPFTKSEKSVLEKISKGYSTKQIAHQLEISEKTVETHRKHLFDKAKVKNVAELIAFAYASKLFME